MVNPTTYEKFFTVLQEKRQALWREEARAKFSQALTSAMENEGVSSEELAKRLGKQNTNYVSQLLNESDSLARFTDAFDALNLDLTLTLTKRRV